MRSVALLMAATAIAILPAAQANAEQSPAGGLNANPEGGAVIAEVAGRGLNEEMEAAGRQALDGAPNDRAASGFHAESLQFSNTVGETDLSLALSFDLGRYNRSASAKFADNKFSISRTRIGVVATVPIEKDKTVHRLFSGDSLVSGSKLKLSLTRFSTSIGLGSVEANEKARRYQGSAYAACLEEFGSKQSEASGTLEEANLTTLQQTANSVGNFARADANDSSIAPFDLTFRRLKASKNEFDQNIAAYCYADADNTNGMHNTGSLIQKYASGSYQEFRAAYIDDKARLSFMGLDASLGRDDHSFLDRTNFKLMSEPRTTWEVGAYYGIIASDLSWSLRARAVYGQSYKDNDEAEICRTVSIPAGNECIKGADGAPVRQRTGLTSLEARKLVTVREGTQIALAPQVTYRFEDKNVGVEVPIYLVPGADGKLTGGIKAVYNSKGDEFGLGLFVGVPFSVFFN